MIDYVLEVLIGVDQLVNTLCGGWADETLSSRAWRLRNRDWFWSTVRLVIDGLMFFQKNHCANAYQAEQQRLQEPPALRMP